MKRGTLYALVGLTVGGVLAYWQRSNIGAAAIGVYTVAEEWLFSLSPENRANRAQWKPTVDAAEAQYGLPATLLDRLLWRESRYRTDIITGALKSSAGAVGIAQFMPATAARFGVNPLDPASAIPGAARYLRTNYDLFAARGMADPWRLAVASYNAGEGAVLKHGGVPPFAETIAYVGEIVDSHGGFA